MNPGVGWVAVALVGCVGCGSTQGVAGLASHAFRVLDLGNASTSLVQSGTLELPAEGELTLSPVLLKVNVPFEEEGVPVRGQIVLRATRHDGGVLQWFVGADGRATAGERGFRLLSSRASHGGFGGADYGPIRVASLAHIEIGFTLLPEPARQRAGFVGLAAVERFDVPRAQLQEAISRDGAAVVWALRLPVAARRDARPGKERQRLVLVGTPGTEPAATQHVHTFDGAELRDTQGNVVPDTSFLVLDIDINVPNHD